MTLVWLFREHRNLFAQSMDQQRQLERLAEKVLSLEKDNQSLAESLAAAHNEIRSNPHYINSVMDLLQRYQEKVLEEQPLAEGQEPEWLTPGYEVAKS